MHVRSKAIAISVVSRHPFSLPFSLSDPARELPLSLCVPSLPICTLCQSSLSFTPTFCLRDILAGDAKKGDAACCTPTHRHIAATAAARREGGKGHVGYLAVPCESVCASYVARVSRHGDSDESAVV